MEKALSQAPPMGERHVWLRTEQRGNIIDVMIVELKQYSLLLSTWKWLNQPHTWAITAKWRVLYLTEGTGHIRFAIGQTDIDGHHSRINRAGDGRQFGLSI